MWDLAVGEAEYATADSLARRVFPVVPLDVRVFDAFARGDSAVQGRMLAEARQSDGVGMPFAAEMIAQHLEDIATAERVARLATAARHKPGVRAAGYRALARLELAAGRWRGAAA